jgi:hypothetical protein
MEKDVLKNIAENISPQNVHAKYIALGKEGYEPVEFSVENYHEIPKGEQCSIAFVDGGNAELAKGPNFSLQYVRACAVVYENGKRVEVDKEECACLVQAKNVDGTLKYEVELYGVEGLNVPAVDLYEASLSEGGNRVEPAKVAELVRKLAELKLASSIIEQLPTNSYVILDGHLQSNNMYELNALREIFEKARSSGVTVAGVCKTNSMILDTGHAAIPALMRQALLESWYYHPIAVSSRQDHQATVAVAKLHPKSDYAFRIDLFDQQEPLLPQLIGVLAEQSTDAAFLGYPYGLTEADRFAKIREEERSYLKSKAEMVFGSALKEEFASQSAHDHLNRAT